ncbi:MAG: hypothetical protein E6G93_18405 [Alphaproteobacteria bacterium]|nr:MAG: hypothetical protein E6G93_18405 [Alphaproteobacteria bacterium]TMK52809.1 MAG: hypothetical protein E6G70_00395 [Alphaproteobacteria bacterium]
MKSITGVAAFVFLTILLVATAPFDGHAVEGAMSGKDPTYRGGVTGVSHGGTGGGGSTCSAAVQRCKKNLPGSAAACASAGESCKQTGTFTNPQGKSFSGLTKN